MCTATAPEDIPPPDAAEPLLLLVVVGITAPLQAPNKTIMEQNDN